MCYIQQLGGMQLMTRTFVLGLQKWDGFVDGIAPGSNTNWFTTDIDPLSQNNLAAPSYQQIYHTPGANHDWCQVP